MSRPFLLPVLPLLFSFSTPFWAALSARAGSVGILTENSSSSKTNGASLNLNTGDVNKDADPTQQTFFDFDLTYNSASSKAADTFGNEVDDKTTDANAEAVWSLVNGIRFGLGVGATTASADDIYGSDGRLILGYRYRFTDERPAKNKPPKLEGDLQGSEVPSPQFTESIGFTIKSGRNNIKQKTAGRLSATTLSLEQGYTEALLDLDLVRWITVYGSYKKYKYNKDLNQILLLLDHPRLADRVGPAFSNDISSLQDNSTSLGLTFHVGDFDIDLNSSKSRLLLTETNYTDNVITVTYFVGRWAIAIGGGQSKSDGVAAIGYSTASLKYNF